MGENNCFSLNGEELDYRGFSGILHSLPHLVEERRTPLSVSGVMKRRLEVALSYKELRDAWWERDFSTRDVALYHPDGRMKIVLDYDIVKELGDITRNCFANPIHKKYSFLGDTYFTWGMSLPLEYYQEIDGEEFSKQEQEKYARPAFRKRKVVENPIWKTLARDRELLEDYVVGTYALSQRSVWYQPLFGEKRPFKKGMGIQPKHGQDEKLHTSLLLWTLSGFWNKSGLYHPKIDNVFNFNSGFIVGVKSE